MAARTMNSFSQPADALKSLPGLPALQLPKSVRSGTAEITRQQYRFWVTMAKSARYHSADGSISRSNADCADAGTKDPVTFDKLKRRMVYDLSNWSNSSTAADACRPCATNRSGTGRSRPFPIAAADQYFYCTHENV